MNDVLGPHIKQDKWKEFERKIHDDAYGIPMKVETHSSNNTEVNKSVNGLTYSGLLWTTGYIKGQFMRYYHKSSI